MLDAAEQNMDTQDSRTPDEQVHSIIQTMKANPSTKTAALTSTCKPVEVKASMAICPDSSADDADENIGEEDEKKNNYYSLGGDLHEYAGRK